MNKPASAPDVMPPHEIPAPTPGSESEGSNETRHTPDPEADSRAPADGGRVPRSPYTHGND